MTIRPAQSSDIPAIGAIAEASRLFPAEMAPDMVAPALAGGTDVWLVAEEDGAPVGFAFARAEDLTDRVWNILAMGVAPQARGAHLATDLLQAIEARLDARMIVIETTQLPDQFAARTLYSKQGYDPVAVIPDFFAVGEDKITFRKVMA